MHRYTLFVYNQHNQGGEIRAKPRRTANFDIQTDDACTGDGDGRAGGIGYDIGKSVPIKPKSASITPTRVKSGKLCPLAKI